jgi:hypothetical protein
MLYQVFSNDRMKETAYHVTDFAGFYPVWPIVKFSMAPIGVTKDDRMTSFIKCLTALLGEMLYVDNTAMIAPIDITNNNEASFIKTKLDLPMNFTKLGKHIMISGGSWVFNKKEKGSNDVYTRFRLKSQIPTEDIINQVSFESSCVGGKNLFKKQHQAMETETPLMLLFVCNGAEILGDPYSKKSPLPSIGEFLSVCHPTYSRLPSTWPTMTSAATHYTQQPP